MFAPRGSEGILCCAGNCSAMKWLLERPSWILKAIPSAQFTWLAAYRNGRPKASAIVLAHLSKTQFLPFQKLKKPDSVATQFLLFVQRRLGPNTHFQVRVRFSRLIFRRCRLSEACQSITAIAYCNGCYSFSFQSNYITIYTHLKRSRGVYLALRKSATSSRMNSLFAASPI